MSDRSASTFLGLMNRLRMSERTFMVVAGLVVGVLGGYGAVGFRLLIRAIQRLAWGNHPFSLELVSGHPWWWIVGVPLVGGAVVGPLVHFLAREAKGHGVPEVMAAVAVNGGLIRPRVVAIKSLASALTIGTGGSVGREGPIVQIGAALGSVMGQILKVSGRRLRTLAGCGAAAGIAATFNAPIAGAIFAVEIILGDFAISQFSPIVIASVIATVVARVHLGDVPAFVVPVHGLQSPVELVFYAVLGVVSGVVGVVFVRTLYGMEDLADRTRIPGWLLTPIGFGLVGVAGLKYPELFGVGYEAIEAALRGEILLGTAALLLLLKILATSVTISAGGSGGVFAPSLFLGAMCGALVGTVANLWMPGVTGPPGAYALVGMGAVVAAGTHAPLTAILIIFELTHDYGLIVPIMGSCIIATLMAQRFGRANIYTLKLLRRGIDLAAGREVNVLRSLRVREVMDVDADTVRPETHLGEIVDRATADGIGYFYVVDAQGRFGGAIGTPELRNALVESTLLRDLVVAADLARTDVPVVEPEDDLDTVMRIFGGKNREELPVVDSREGGRLLGTISRGHLLESYNRELMKRDMVAEIAGDLASSDRSAVFLGENHWMKQLETPGTFHGHTLAELDVRGRHGVQIVLVRRPKRGAGAQWMEQVPGPDTRLELGDVLVVVGDRQAVERLEAL